jgi:hypothetical protein
MSVEIGVTKTPDGKLRGWTQHEDIALRKMRAKINRLKPGAMLKLSYSQPRNLGHHRKFFALVQAVAENSEIYDTTDKALVAVKLAAGHVDFVPHPETGELTAVPKSIAFQNMDQAAFDEFYERAVAGVIAHICPHMTRMDLDEAVEMVGRF